MHVGLSLVIDSEPSTVHAVSVIQFIKDPITPQDYEVMIILNFERLDVRDCNNYSRVATIFRKLRLDVSKSSRYRKPTWENSMGSQEILTFDSNTTKGRDLSESFGLINLTSSL